MFNIRVIESRKEVLIGSLMNKSVKELKDLREEWHKLYLTAKDMHLKKSANMHFMRCRIIDETLKRKGL
jgi:hypothetical protein